MSVSGYNPSWPPSQAANAGYHMYNFHHVRPYHAAALALPITVLDDSAPSDLECSPSHTQPKNQSASSQFQTPTQNYVSVAVKVINPIKKSDTKLYMLRNIDKDNVGTLSNFKETIFEQFGDKVVSSELEFEIGYYQNNKRIWVRNEDDFNDVKRLIHSNDTITLWCMGVHEIQRRRKA